MTVNVALHTLYLERTYLIQGVGKSFGTGSELQKLQRILIFRILSIG